MSEKIDLRCARETRSEAEKSEKCIYMTHKRSEIDPVLCAKKEKSFFEGQFFSFPPGEEEKETGEKERQKSKLIKKIYGPDQYVRKLKIRNICSKLLAEKLGSLNYTLNYRVVSQDGKILDAFENGAVYQETDKNARYIRCKSMVSVKSTRLTNIESPLAPDPGADYNNDEHDTIMRGSRHLSVRISLDDIVQESVAPCKSRSSKGLFQDQKMHIYREPHKVNSLPKQPETDFLNELKNQREAFSRQESFDTHRSTLKEAGRAIVVDGSCKPPKAVCLIVGLTHLKILNEAYGAVVANRIIAFYNDEIKRYVSSLGMCRRISGDRFGVILYHPEDLEGFIEKIGSLSSCPFNMGGISLRISAEIGYCPFDNAGGNSYDFIEKAEKALEVAQQRGRGACVAFDPTCMDFHKSHARSLLDVGEVFLDAFENGRLRMAYQPIIDVQKNEVMFYESLLRAVDRRGKLIGADVLTPALLKLGMIRIADLFALRSALDELEKHQDISLSVNVTQTSLVDPQWCAVLDQRLSLCPDLGRRLIVEIIETGKKESQQNMRPVIRNFKEKGVRFAVDDFGAGHTNFSEVLNLEIDILKIDKQFIAQSADAGRSAFFIEALQGLANKIGIVTIGEGVETLKQKESFLNQGVRAVQGYLYGRPSLEKAWCAA